MAIEALPPAQSRSAINLLTARPIWLVLAAGLAVRLVLAHFVGEQADLRQFETWSRDLGDNGPVHFYEGPNFKDYLPGYLYYLWALGLGARWFGYGADTYNYLLKLPSIAADLGSAYLLYLVLAGRPERTRLLAAWTYLALPTALFVGALWGQVDSLLAFALLLIVYLFDKKKPVAAAAVFAGAFLTKPQALAALPILAFWGMRDYPPRVWGKCVAAALIVAAIMVLPFFPDHPWDIVSEAYDAAQVFNYNASFTYNFFGAFGWFRDSDQTFWFIHWWQWGVVLTVVAEAAIIYSLRKSRGPGMMALGVALSMLAFFEFQTRMHERYMFFTFLPLLASCFYLNRRLLWFSFAGLTLMQFFELYLAFFYPTFNGGDPSWLYYEWLPRMLGWSPQWWHRAGSFAQFLCCCFVLAITLALMAYAFLLNNRVRIEPVSADEQVLGRPTALGPEWR